MSATKDDVLKDSNAQRRTLADYGITYASDEWLSERGLTVADKSYETPVTTAEAKQQKLVALAAEYADDVAAINGKVLAALTNAGAGSAKLTAAQSEFSTRKAKYLSDRAAIINS